MTWVISICSTSIIINRTTDDDSRTIFAHRNTASRPVVFSSSIYIASYLNPGSSTRRSNSLFMRELLIIGDEVISKNALLHYRIFFVQDNLSNENTLWLLTLGKHIFLFWCELNAVLWWGKRGSFFFPSLLLIAVLELLVLYFCVFANLLISAVPTDGIIRSSIAQCSLLLCCGNGSFQKLSDFRLLFSL